MSRWRLLGECPGPKGPVQDSEVISIEGLNPWRHRWVALGQQIVLPDPRHASKRLHLTVYELEGADRKVIFAMGGLPGNSWVFYLPATEGTPGACDAMEPKYEGYWRTSNEDVSELPWPTHEPTWMRRSTFLDSLEKAEAEAERVAWRGFSNCRVCGCRNGHESLRLEEWEWPAGYKHYVVDHNVRPSAEFESFILGRSA